jgi:hypothetical protein
LDSKLVRRKINPINLSYVVVKNNGIELRFINRTVEQSRREVLAWVVA